MSRFGLGSVSEQTSFQIPSAQPTPSPTQPPEGERHRSYWDVMNRLTDVLDHITATILFYAAFMLAARFVRDCLVGCLPTEQ